MYKFTDIKKTHVVTTKKKVVEKINENSSLLENVKLTEVEKLFSKLFESREIAHIHHLQTRGDEGSYAKHMALNAYYEGIIDLIDDTIETYQGQFGIIENYDIIDTTDINKKDVVEYFEEVASFVKENRYKAIPEEETHLHSLLDDVVCLIYKTLYKLKFNK